jgi:hypothetical protein
MKLPTTEEFTYKDCVIAGDDCWLITPNHIGCKWTDENARFRSCIVRKSDNKVLSQSLPKFKNWHEDPEFQSWDHSWPVQALHKIDGSTIIFSCHNNQMILRTRGVESVFTQETGPEVHKLIEFYPDIKNFVRDGKHSVIFEHTGPSRIIVLREHNIPTLTLLAIVDNETAIMFPQDEVDSYAQKWNISRPKRYHYKTVEECIMDIKVWEHAEGVVLYSPDGNTLKKIKADLYLSLHSLATGIKNINQVLDLFMTTEKFTKYEDFYNFVKFTMDFEIAEKIKDDMFKIVTAYNKVLEKMKKVDHVIDGIRGDSFTRKDQAMCIMQHWQDWRESYGFVTLDNKVVEDKLIKSAIESEL